MQVESLLRDRDEADVNDISDEQDEQQVGPVLRALGQQRQRDAEQSVEAEFFQHARVKHGGGRGRGGVGLRRPGMKREERNRMPKPTQQEKIRSDLRGGGNEAVGCARACSSMNVKRARSTGTAR